VSAAGAIFFAGAASAADTTGFATTEGDYVVHDFKFRSANLLPIRACIIRRSARRIAA